MHASSITHSWAYCETQILSATRLPDPHGSHPMMCQSSDCRNFILLQYLIAICNTQARSRNTTSRPPLSSARPIYSPKAWHCIPNVMGHGPQALLSNLDTDTCEAALFDNAVRRCGELTSVRARQCFSHARYHQPQSPG